jgi:outer membrane lipase/esterase
MSTRRRWHLSALAVVAALVVAGCGGGTTDSPLATRVIAFGDSLTDIGAYTPATQIPLGQAAGVPPFFGGKFTTNTHTGYTATSNTSTANIWVEWIAARLGVAITPHEVGFGPVPNRVKCPAAASNPALAGSCTGYAQGGSRVTSPAGIGNPNGNGINGANPAPMTIPMVQQVADHLTRFTNFGSDDIVFVFGGNNDVFVQLAAAATIGPVAATANVQTAATELANLVRNQILANGARRVAVMTLPDASTAPQFLAADANTRALVSSLSAAFNATLLTALNGADVRIIDVRALNAAVQASPATYGLTNITTPACDPARIQTVTGGRITDGSSLFCNGAPASAFVTPVPNLNTLRTGASASAYLFADGVHPTTGGHRILADQVWNALKDFGWVPDNL